MTNTTQSPPTTTTPEPMATLSRLSLSPYTPTQPSVVPPRPPLPPAPVEPYKFTNDVFFNTSDELQPVPVPPPVPSPEPVRDVDYAPPPLYVFKQPKAFSAEDRRFVYKPGPVRTDVVARLGIDDDAQGGASAQLLAVGPQNVMLDINPQMSFFKAVYKRHTDFALECFDQDMPLKLGGTTTLTLQRRGDLLADMFLEIRLPNLGIADGRWADCIGYVLMNRAKLKIDDITIHDHERLWYDIHDKLFMPHGRRLGLDAMIGRDRVLATDKAHIVYLPFKFLCCRNQYRNQQFLPMASLTTKSTLSLEFSCVSLDSCLVLPPGTAVPATVQTLPATLLSEQIFVEQDEQRAMITRSWRLMIETVQDVDALSYQFDDAGSTDLKTATLDLSELNSPVKSLAFVAYDENSIDKRKFFTYLDCVSKAVMLISSSERFAPRSGDYFSLVQTYRHAARCTPDRVHMYSFALEADQRQPSGALNFAVLDRPTLRIDLKNTTGKAVKLKAFAHSINWLKVESGSMAFMFQ